MKLVVEIVAGITLIFMALVIGYGLWVLIRIPTNRWRAGAFDFVYVNDDGSVRELHSKEEAQLNSLFFVGDSTNFYIKPQYESRNSSGELSGYIKRRQLPKALERQLPLGGKEV
jgi:hypothetical protein